MRALAAATVTLLLAGSVAQAAPASAGRRLAIPVVPTVAHGPSAVARAGQATLLLERCRGGCAITYGERDDARTFTSSVPQGPGAGFRIGEFVNGDGQSGAAADAEWQAVLACVRDVYSPYAVDVTEVRPTGGNYHLAVVAGSPVDVGYPRDVLGVAPLATDCSQLENAVSFTFATVHGVRDRVANLCWTVAQESAHAFGLDHVYEQLDGTSACNDPMTYRTDCGGRKYFRNTVARCGTVAPVPCQCGATQNTHAALLARLGAGSPTTPLPTVMLVEPTPHGGPLPAAITVTAASPRGVNSVELLLNDYPWVSVPGVPFGEAGQPAATYTLGVPAGLPPSLVDVVVRVREDLPGRATATAPLTLVHGAACTSAEGCLAHQRCTAGHCRWDPPVAEVGEACDYPQYCASGVCEAATCTQPCELGCPAGFACGASGDLAGYCVAEGGGGCSATRDPRGVTPGVLLVLIALRRRRRMG